MLHAEIVSSATFWKGTWASKRIIFTNIDGLRFASAERPQPRSMFWLAALIAFIWLIIVPNTAIGGYLLPVGSVAFAGSILLVLLRWRWLLSIPLRYTMGQDLATLTVIRIGAGLFSNATYTIRDRHWKEMASLHLKQGHLTASTVGGETFKCKRAPKPRWLPIHIEFESPAGCKATLHESDRRDGAYSLSYDEGFQPDWLLFVAAAYVILVR
jgi:hypothetical protein